MTGPPLQRLGPAVLLQNIAVQDAYYLLSAGLRATRRGGVAVPGRFLQLQAELASAAAEVRASADGHNDVAPPVAQAQSTCEDSIGTREAANALQLSPRQVQRIARDLDGRFVGGCWVFDRLAVHSYAAFANDHRSRPAA